MWSEEGGFHTLRGGGAVFQGFGSGWCPVLFRLVIQWLYCLREGPGRKPGSLSFGPTGLWLKWVPVPFRSLAAASSWCTPRGRVWVAPQMVPAAPVRRTLESEWRPDGGGSGCPVNEEAKETTGEGIRLVLVCGLVISRQGWPLRMFP